MELALGLEGVGIVVVADKNTPVACRSTPQMESIGKSGLGRCSSGRDKPVLEFEEQSEGMGGWFGAPSCSCRVVGGCSLVLGKLAFLERLVRSKKNRRPSMEFYLWSRF